MEHPLSVGDKKKANNQGKHIESDGIKCNAEKMNVKKVYEVQWDREEVLTMVFREDLTDEVTFE